MGAGLCRGATAEVRDELYVLQFQQPDEAFQANGGLVFQSLIRGQDIPIRNISCKSQFVYFNDRQIAVPRPK